MPTPTSAPLNLLVVEDDEALAKLFVGIANKRALRSTCATTIAEGKRILESGDVDLLLTDVRLPDGSGLDLIEWTRQTDPRIVVVAVTAFGSIEIAVRAVKQGAYDFLTKPVEPASLGVALDRAMEARALRGEVEALRGALATEHAVRDVIGKSAALHDIMSLVRRVADSPATVLITGPSGSGKERIARALHDASKRKDKSFVAVNSAAIPEALLESELFGYTKGAFTDARQDKKGLFSEAHGGTLFLDEIGDLPLVLQAKILRVLEERQVRPLGSTRTMPIDVRVVAATHHDLRKAVAEGRFREDLFYRLAVIEVAIPPLRDRPEDILPLAEHFLKRAAERARLRTRGFSGAAARLLMAHQWPGNVRELENAVERAVALSNDEWISPDDLPAAVQKPKAPELFAGAAERMMTLEDVERAYVEHVLERCGGNKVRAAAALGISRRTIQRWVGGSPDEES